MFRSFVLYIFEKLKIDEKSSDNKKKCKTFTNEQKRDVKHSHKNKETHTQAP